VDGWGTLVWASAKQQVRIPMTTRENRRVTDTNLFLGPRNVESLGQLITGTYLIAWQRQELLILMSAFAHAFLKRASTAAASGFFAAFKVSARP